MTLTSGLLLLLEPGPIRLSGVSLQNVDNAHRSVDPEALLFDTKPAPDPRRWSQIIIYHSASQTGSAAQIHDVHTDMGLGGLGYHFVINNGSGGQDGEIEIGYRWINQRVGAHAFGPNRDWANRHAIGICLIGDPQRQAITRTQFDQLVWIVQRLQAHFNIDAGNVVVYGSPSGDEATGPGDHFPVGSFRSQLLTRAAP